MMWLTSGATSSSVIDMWAICGDWRWADFAMPSLWRNVVCVATAERPPSTSRTAPASAAALADGRYMRPWERAGPARHFREACYDIAGGDPVRSKPIEVFKIGFPLPRPPIITGLVLGADKSMRTAAFLRSQIEIAAVLPDHFLQMAAFSLRRFERPGSAAGIGKEGVEFLAVLAAAGNHAAAPPIRGRLQDEPDPRRK